MINKLHKNKLFNQITKIWKNAISSVINVNNWLQKY